MPIGAAFIGFNSEISVLAVKGLHPEFILRSTDFNY